MADNNTFTAEERDSAVSAALATERGRVADLRKLAGAHGATDAELTAAIDGNVTVAAFAVQMADKAEGARAAAAAAAETARLTAEATARTDEETRLAALKKDEESASGAGISPGSEPEGGFPPPTSWPMKSSHRPRP
jgi:hypothetical protein